MSFKSSLLKSAGKLLGVFNQKDLSLRGAVQTLKMSFFASGGTEITFGGYKAHIFESGTSDNFEVRSGSTTIDLLVVGGGGGGGGGGSNGVGGGGGGGAVIYETGYTITSATNGPRIYPISIGAGGASGNPASNGGNSSFSTTHIAAGGGGSTRRAPSQPWPSAGKPGGSGGGEGNGGGGGAGQADPALSTYPSNATIYGNHGAQFGGAASSAGAGGGAGSAGRPRVYGGMAGTGIRIDIVPGSTGPVTLPAPEIPLGYYWASGGGAASSYHSEQNGGEFGGGGAAAINNAVGGTKSWTTGGNGAPGVSGSGGAGTGGGGGAGGPNYGGNGGSGIVIVKYLW